MTPQTWTALKLRALDLAELIDAWRFFPRVVLTAYGYLCWHTHGWYTAIKVPTTEQTAFATAIIGLAVPLTAFYMQTGRAWKT